MDVKVLEKSERKIVIQIDETDTGILNTLRRIMLNEIPILGIEDVEFVENTSGFYDEILANRLGLIPFTFSKMNMRNECKCNGKGCSSCQVSISLDKKGPCLIKAGDLVSDSQSVKPFDLEIPIVELLEGQVVKFEATAELGLGSDHAKWQPAVVGYRYFPIVRSTGKGDLDAALKVCPQNVFEKRGGSVAIARGINCDLCMRCTEVSDGVSINHDDTKFIMTIESVSGLSAEEVFLKALDVLEEKSEDFLKAVKAEL